MKKFLIVFALALVCVSVFASDLFSFAPISQVPLYTESPADPYAFCSNLGVIMATDSNQRPNQILSIITDKVSDSDYRVFNDFLKYDDDAFKPANNKYIHMKTGTSVGLFRVRFEGYKWVPSVDAEFNIAGSINSIFTLFGKNDTLDFDGSYFLGGSLRVADLVTFRFGLHHFSGHYGDEMLSKYFAYNHVNTDVMFNGGALFDYVNAEAGHEYYLIDPVEYVRDNSLIFGVSSTVPVSNRFSIRVYAESELPKNPSWLRPFVHVPADYENPVNESSRPTLIDRIGGTAIDGEQFPQYQLDEEQELKRTANGSYKAWRIHSGVEVRMDLGFGAIFLAGDLQLHQDGMTKHQVGGYDNANPWEMEYTVGGGIELGEFLTDGKVARLEVFYHDGRTPATQWFYQRMKYVSVGLGIN